MDNLPPEILLDMFSYLAADRPNAARTHSRTNFAFTHVCKYWREVALAEPRLWTRIYVTSPIRECVDVMIARSQDLPLVAALIGRGVYAHPRGVYKLSDPFPPPFPPYDIVMDQLHRIVDLDIVPRRWITAQWTEDELSAVPMLKHLRIDASKIWHEWFFPLDILVSGDPFLLESLEILSYHARWTWESCHLSYLKHLSVHAGDTTQSWITTYRFDDVLQVLACSPLLETVSLLNVIPDPRDAPHRQELVRLPRLRKLNLKSHTIRMSALVDMLSFPPNTQCSYDSSFDRESTALAYKLLAPFAGFLRRLTLRTNRDIDHWTAYKEGQPEAIVELHHRRSNSFLRSIPDAFCDVDALTLQWSRISAYSHTILLGTSSRLLLVSTLRIEGAWNSMHFLQTFGKLSELAFHKLRELELPDLDKRWHPAMGNRRTEIVGELILKALEARRTQGHSRLVVLRVPRQLLGPWEQAVLDAQLVEFIEAI
jgi:hypothetical protein